jgi:hypothetical protein
MESKTDLGRAEKKISRRSQIGWSTHGHSGVDVNLYAAGYRSNELRGSRENFEVSDDSACERVNAKEPIRECVVCQIGRFIADCMDLDQAQIDKDLNR